MSSRQLQFSSKMVQSKVGSDELVYDKDLMHAIYFSSKLSDELDFETFARLRGSIVRQSSRPLTPTLKFPEEK